MWRSDRAVLMPVFLTLVLILLLTGNVTIFFFWSLFLCFSFFGRFFDAWWGFSFIYHIANFQSLVKVKPCLSIICWWEKHDYVLKPMGILPTSQRYIICINNCIVLSDRKSFEWTWHHSLGLTYLERDDIFSHNNILFSPDSWTDGDLGLRFYKKQWGQTREEPVGQKSCLQKVQVTGPIYHENLLVFTFENSSVCLRHEALE